ncbi:uncharacterized protein F5Z01DRAFT_672185 [Emericellopsis atlantica]|uniref:Extracellular membrane protein CFEM domain-containing protein n=1 Tax=Emericellopsis atlantica TaxID=2614577 RepID=A0A9P7ZQX2_9HYPO|nr:uncharacterized protein F5Z01DRAFT_672185 [Emericellopsis atlantica]KAG9256191.1 hypothetical protein F5Z01DRAFT_672185 [Emericellopsis atlantica]
MPSNTVYVPLLLALLHAALGQTVTVGDDVPYAAHRCVKYCVQHPFGVGTDIGVALQCGDPYEEDCYCATEDDSLTLVSEHINNCASTSCSAGDLTKDVSSMRSLYASYCRGKGYTQDFIEGWYTAATGPEATEATTTTTDEDKSTKTTAVEETEKVSESEEGQVVETSTDTTVATQTREPEDEDDSASISRVIVSRTSILWVDNTAEPDARQEEDGGGGVNTTALGAGLGVGVPLVLALVGAGIWLCMRQRRRKQVASEEEQQRPPSYSQVDVVPAAGGTGKKTASVHKVVETQQDKLELAGQGIRRELAGQQIHPFPTQTVYPAVVVPGQHEMVVEDRPHEMQGSVRASERHELPGQYHY